MAATIKLRPGRLSLVDCASLAAGGVALRLDPGAWKAVEASAATIARVLKEGRPVYGINTGFGSRPDAVNSDAVRKLF